MKILANSIKCNHCGDHIYSAHRHDFRYCECGAVAVDGGMDYQKRVGTDYTDTSIVVTDEQFKACMDALKWCDDTGRNNLGRLCAVMRALRDTGYLDER